MVLLATPFNVNKKPGFCLREFFKNRAGSRDEAGITTSQLPVKSYHTPPSVIRPCRYGPEHGNVCFIFCCMPLIGQHKHSADWAINRSCRYHRTVIPCMPKFVQKTRKNTLRTTSGYAYSSNHLSVSRYNTPIGVVDCPAYSAISRVFGEVVIEQATAQKGDVSSKVSDGPAKRLPNNDTRKPT